MLSGNWCILASVLLKSSRGDGCSLCSSTGPFHAYSFAYPCPSSGPPEVRCFGARLSSPPFFESPVLSILRCAQQPQCQERLPETWAPVPSCLERFFTSKAKRIVPFPELPRLTFPLFVWIPVRTQAPVLACPCRLSSLGLFETLAPDQLMVPLILVCSFCLPPRPHPNLSLWVLFL